MSDNPPIATNHNSETPLNASSEKVSFIVPAYNAARFISETLDSILSQSYTNLEVVVVDDGSTDNTRELVSQSNDPRVHLYDQQNAGPSAARNLGFEKSSGELIWYLDADDIILPDTVNSLLNTLHQQPAAAGAVGRWSLMDEAGQATSPLMNVPADNDVTSESLFPEMLLRTVFPVGATVFRRSVVEQAGGWDADLWCAEDRDFYLRMLEHKAVFAVSDVDVFRYRVHSSNSTLNLERVESHSIAYLNKWFGPDGRVPDEYKDLGPYAWCLAYLYMARKCNRERQSDAAAAFITTAGEHLNRAVPNGSLINGILWDEHGSHLHGKIRRLVWPKDADVVAEYCWVNAITAMRRVRPVESSRLLGEVLIRRPSHLFGKLRRLVKGKHA